MRQPSAGVVIESQRIGYVRASTVAQTLDQQSEALEAAGATKPTDRKWSGHGQIAATLTWVPVDNGG